MFTRGGWRRVAFLGEQTYVILREGRIGFSDIVTMGKGTELLRGAL